MDSFEYKWRKVIGVEECCWWSIWEPRVSIVVARCTRPSYGRPIKSLLIWAHFDRKEGYRGIIIFILQCQNSHRRHPYMFFHVHVHKLDDPYDPLRLTLWYHRDDNNPSFILQQGVVIYMLSQYFLASLLHNITKLFHPTNGNTSWRDWILGSTKRSNGYIKKWMMTVMCC